MKKLPIDVRVDYYKNGNIIPILFIDEDGNTTPIKSVEQIRYNVKNLNEGIEFVCNVYEKQIKLMLINNKWYFIL